MRILVTGASGYIGTRLISKALQDGHFVMTTSHSKSESLSCKKLYFDLSNPYSIAIPDQIDVIIHLAANTTHSNIIPPTKEIESAEILLKASQAIGAKFIFVSSQTAAIDTATIYGKTKWHIERNVLAAGGVVVRPGQVYGGELRGLFGSLAKHIKRLPILPDFIPAPMIQPIHIDDLVKGLLAIATRPDMPSKIFHLATPKPISFSIFLKIFAESRIRCTKIFLPTPVIAIKILERTFGTLIKSQSWSSQLRSLLNLPLMATASDLTELDIQIRPLHSGMHPSGSVQRRNLLLEGAALLANILNKPPCNFLIRRYVRAMEYLRNGHSLELPKMLLMHPNLLSSINSFMWVNKANYAEYLWRLDSATIIAESTPGGFMHFIDTTKNAKIISILMIIKAGGLAFFWLIVGIIFCPYFRHLLNFNQVPHDSKI